MISLSGWPAIISQYDPNASSNVEKVILVDRKGVPRYEKPETDMSRVSISNIFIYSQEAIQYLTQENVKSFYKGLKKIYRLHAGIIEDLGNATKTLNDIKKIKKNLLAKNLSKTHLPDNGDKIIIDDCLNFIAVLALLPPISLIRVLGIIISMQFVSQPKKHFNDEEYVNNVEFIFKMLSSTSFKSWEKTAKNILKQPEHALNAESALKTKLNIKLFKCLQNNRLPIAAQLINKADFTKFLQTLKQFVINQQPCVPLTRANWDKSLSFIKHFLFSADSVKFNIEKKINELKSNPNAESEYLINKDIQAAMIFMEKLKNEFAAENRCIDAEKKLLQQLLDYEIGSTEFENKANTLLESYLSTFRSPKDNEVISIENCKTAIKALRLLSVNDSIRKLGFLCIYFLYKAIVDDVEVNSLFSHSFKQFFINSYLQMQSHAKLLNNSLKNTFQQEQVILDDNQIIAPRISNKLPTKKILNEFVRRIKQFAHSYWYNQLDFIKYFLGIPFFNIEARILDAESPDLINDCLQRVHALLRIREKFPELFDADIHLLVIKYLNCEISTPDFDAQSIKQRLASIKKSIGIDSSTKLTLEALNESHDTETNNNYLLAIETIDPSSWMENKESIKELLNMETSIEKFRRKISQTPSSIQEKDSNYNTRLKLIKKSINDSDTTFLIETVLNDSSNEDYIARCLLTVESLIESPMKEKNIPLIKNLLNFATLVDDFLKQKNQPKSIRSSQINSPRVNDVKKTATRGLDKGKDKVDEDPSGVSSDQTYNFQLDDLSSTLDKIYRYIPDIQCDVDELTNPKNSFHVNEVKNFLELFENEKRDMNDSEKQILTNLINFNAKTAVDKKEDTQQDTGSSSANNNN